MKIQFLSQFKTSGYDGVARSFGAGQIVEVTDDFAKWLVNCGAEVVPAVDVPVEAERAPEAPQHDRMTRRGRKREATE